MRTVARTAAGVSPHRRLPRFATTTFTLVLRGAAACPRRPRGDPVARHVHEPLRAAGRNGGPRRARGSRLPRQPSPCRPLLRPTTLRLRLPRPRTALPRADPERAPRRDPSKASRWSGSSRAASRYSATSSRSCCRTTRTRDGSRGRPSISPSSSAERRPDGRRPASTAACSCTATATDERQAPSTPNVRCSSGWAQRSTHRRRAAAVWPAPGATRRRTSTSRGPARNVFCYRRSAMPIRPHCLSRAVSRVEARSLSSAPGDPPFTSQKLWHIDWRNEIRPPLMGLRVTLRLTPDRESTRLT